MTKDELKQKVAAEVTEEKNLTHKGEGLSDEQYEQLKQIFPFMGKEYEKYEYGDLHVWCNQCGSDTAMMHPGMRNLQTSFITQTNIDSQSVWALSCGVCGNRLALHVKPAVNPPKPQPVEEGPNDEISVEDSTDKQTEEK